MVKLIEFEITAQLYRLNGQEGTIVQIQNSTQFKKNVWLMWVNLIKNLDLKHYRNPNQSLQSESDDNDGNRFWIGRPNLRH